jgi:opacity protein-like surface antigen
MKKISLFIFAILITFISANGQLTKIGGGLGFTTGYPFHKMSFASNKSGNFYIYAKGIYEIKLPVHLSPSLTFFFPHVWKMGDVASEEKVTVSTLMIDLNGHYVFNSLDRFEFYGLAGLDILLAWKKDVTKILITNPTTQTVKESDNAIGLNLGLGTYMKITEQIDLNVEAKYLVSKYHQFMINAGVLVNLQWLSKHENDTK